MIGKPEWFTYRIFGWGLRPRTWQGWAYVAVFIMLFLGIASMPISETAKMSAMWVLMGILIIDAVHLMTVLPKFHDERQNQHHLIIEKNVSLAAVLALVGVALMQTYQNRGLDTGMLPFDWSIAVILGVMVLTKIVSTVYVNKKM
ncbi:hypothetical protein CMO89_00315 [Candidatus Woesearchaeota archaeon]|nr:hypothetical protein [Candidatus Woesearchaeota archaeon]|tara:strand:+ start:2090 stop:2524 length:435 start_codon:yes stop_codon:yes gene_type:complete